MVRFALLLAMAGLGGCTAQHTDKGPAFHLVSGAVPLDRGPDGNSVFLDAPDGLILVDTGRHPAHAAKLLDHARGQGRPIAAIINTHWHLDHTTGNHDIRQAHPAAQVYATTAIEGALAGFLNANRAAADKMLADPETPPGRKAEILRGRSVIDNPDRLRPTRPVASAGRMTIAGRPIDVRIAPFAATEADLWLYLPDQRLAIVGDLVVDLVPFMDTACPDGWKKALEAIAATPFVTLIPGHGAPMNRTQFLTWKNAFDAFLDCARSTQSRAQCIAGWKRDAAPFIAATHATYAGEAAGYYVDTRLRSAPEERQRYCGRLK